MVGVVHTAHCNWILNKKGQNQNVPSIEEIQKTLVMLGDKNQKFIDSLSLLLLLTFKTVTTENVVKLLRNIN
uniref:Uncharacterized protein n=1 Tax=Glossina palpalis gambiensis TaxID=67801 RepID=A0A1B0BG24_9MUSC